MKKNTVILSTQHPQALSAALNVIALGGLIVFPTDTLYGLAADPTNPQAIKDIYTAKERSIEKAIPILIGSIDHFDLITYEADPKIIKLATHFWPGALTLVLKKKPGLPMELSQTETLGIRMPAHPFALSLLQKTGPLATTSANLSGAPDPLSAGEVLLQLDGRIDLILDGGMTAGGKASTVVDCTGRELVILREGPVTVAELNQIWNEP
jgi:L-threonylcarbamoyladenylate synthase